MNDLTRNIDKIHTTELGKKRIKKNVRVETNDIVEWCRTKIMDSRAAFKRKGKNWYISIENFEITINAHSYTIITAHKHSIK